METKNTPQTTFSLETLISNLRNEDMRNLRLMKQMQQFMWAVALLYLLMTILELSFSNSWHKPFGGLLVMISFLIFAFFFRIYHREYKLIDYGLPTIEMLAKAAKRYQIFQWRALTILIPLAIEDIGLCFFLYDFFNIPDPLSRFLLAQFYFALAITIGFIIGYAIWYVRQKPLRDRALELIRELES